MYKYQVVFRDGTITDVMASDYHIHNGFLIFYSRDVTLGAFAVDTVKSFSQLPAGAV